MHILNKLRYKILSLTMLCLGLGGIGILLIPEDSSIHDLLIEPVKNFVSENIIKLDKNEDSEKLAEADDLGERKINFKQIQEKLGLKEKLSKLKQDMDPNEHKSPQLRLSSLPDQSYQSRNSKSSDSTSKPYARKLSDIRPIGSKRNKKQSNTKINSGTVKRPNNGVVSLSKSQRNNKNPIGNIRDASDANLDEGILSEQQIPLINDREEQEDEIYNDVQPLGDVPLDELSETQEPLGPYEFNVNDFHRGIGLVKEGNNKSMVKQRIAGPPDTPEKTLDPDPELFKKVMQPLGFETGTLSISPNNGLIINKDGPDFYIYATPQAHTKKVSVSYKTVDNKIVKYATFTVGKTKEIPVDLEQALSANEIIIKDANILTQDLKDVYNEEPSESAGFQVDSVKLINTIRHSSNKLAKNQKILEQKDTIDKNKSVKKQDNMRRNLDYEEN